MARILIIEHGPPGSANDLAEKFTKIFPQHHIEVTDHEKALHLVVKESWALVVVDVQGSKKEAFGKTIELPGALDFEGGVPIVFLTEQPMYGNGVEDPVLCDSDTTRTVFTPWEYSQRKHAAESVDTVLREAVRKQKRT